VNSSELAPIKPLIDSQLKNKSSWSGWLNEWLWGWRKTAEHMKDHEEMADITLSWMIDQCRPFLEFDNNFLHEIFERHAAKLTKVKGHEFAYANGPLIDSFASFQKLSTSKTRTPGQYSPEDNTTDLTAIKERTNEYFHPSVRLRYEGAGKSLDINKLYRESEALHDIKPVDKPVRNASGTMISKGDPMSSNVVWEKKVDGKEIDGKKLQISEWQIRPNATSTEYIAWQHEENKRARGRKLDKTDPRNNETKYSNEKRPLQDLQFFGSFVPDKGVQVLQGSFQLAIMGPETWRLLANPVKKFDTDNKKKN